MPATTATESDPTRMNVWENWKGCSKYDFYWLQPVSGQQSDKRGPDLASNCTDSYIFWSATSTVKARHQNHLVKIRFKTAIMVQQSLQIKQVNLSLPSNTTNMSFVIWRCIDYICQWLPKLCHVTDFWYYTAKVKSWVGLGRIVVCVYSVSSRMEMKQRRWKCLLLFFSARSRSTRRHQKGSWGLSTCGTTVHGHEQGKCLLFVWPIITHWATVCSHRVVASG